MKKLLMILFMALCFMFITKTSRAQDIYTNPDDTQMTSRMVNRQFSALQADGEVIPHQTNELLPDFNIDDAVKKISSGEGIGLSQNFYQRLVLFFMKEIYLNLHTMFKLVALAVICGMLSHVQSSFGREGVSEIAFFACYMLLAALAVQSFTYASKLGQDVTQNMVTFMQSLVPVLTTMLATTGSMGSAAVFQPAVLACVQIVANIITNFIMPLIFFTVALSIINNITQHQQLSKLIGLLKSSLKWVIGVVLLAFVGIMTVQGLTASVVDGVTMRAAKFSVGHLVPVVGGVLSEAVSTVAGCAQILKNAVGVGGLISVLVICIVPLIKILALMIIYRLAAAFIEPVSDKRLVDCISEMGDCLGLVFSMVLSVTLMFLVCTTIFIAASNITLMVR